jgi:hypothetical protein
MELSSTSINVANVTVIATIHGLMLGRHGAVATTGLLSGMSDSDVAVAIVVSYRFYGAAV